MEGEIKQAKLEECWVDETGRFIVRRAEGEGEFEVRDTRAGCWLNAQGEIQSLKCQIMGLIAVRAAIASFFDLVSKR